VGHAYRAFTVSEIGGQFLSLQLLYLWLSQLPQTRFIRFFSFGIKSGFFFTKNIGCPGIEMFLYCTYDSRQGNSHHVNQSNKSTWMVKKRMFLNVLNLGMITIVSDSRLKH